ncbi:hypothetical protein DFS34DRAFT_104622 [Phlyctochytrium arcticum]|nr:hypothetical protein DFS34DRAFT_104622 [Phlyctochytrium arcticum]
MATKGGVSRFEEIVEYGDTEDDEVTRCLCGRTDSFGVMVQCEDCFVWQHCECMNVNPRKLPKHYYCERCQPAHHFRSHPQRAAAIAARERPHVPPPPVATPTRISPTSAAAKSGPKKRNTMNSREAAQPYTELLMFDETGAADAHPDAQSQSGDSPSRRSSHDVKEDKSPTVESAPTTELRVSVNGLQETRRRTSESVSAVSDVPLSAKRKREQIDSPTPLVMDSPKHAQDKAPLTPKLSAEVKSPVTNGRANVTNEEPEPEIKSKRAKVDPPSRKASNNNTTHHNTRNGKSTRPQRTLNRHPSNRDVTDQASHPSPATNTHESEPYTVKVRIPHARSTLGEMNKRVKQLSDYITRLQVSMAAEPKFCIPDEPAEGDHGKPALLLTTKDNSTAAQTPPSKRPLIPLPSPAGSAPELMRSPDEMRSANPTTTESPSPLQPPPSATDPSKPPSTDMPDSSITPISSTAGPPPREETSLEMLDRLNRALIKFQERFGSHSRR